MDICKNLVFLDSFGFKAARWHVDIPKMLVFTITSLIYSFVSTI